MAQPLFNRAVERWINRTRGGVQQRVKAAAIGLHSRVIDRSPVDTGRFRASWNIVSGEDADLSVAKEGQNTGGGAAAKARASALTASNSYVISNNLPYAESLENGHSKQAPQGVVRLSIIDVQTNIEAFGAPTI
jgi:hypothetical protein